MNPPFPFVIEQAGANFSAHLPDLPGCVATGETQEQVIQHIREANAFRFEGLTADAQSQHAIKLPQHPPPAG